MIYGIIKLHKRYAAYHFKYNIPWVKFFKNDKAAIKYLQDLGFKF
jgi:hypothetical protein